MKKLLTVVLFLLSVSSTHAAWKYENSKDKMTDKSVQTASVQSKNSFQLDFPYKGMQKATLLIRNHPQYGIGVVLWIEKGQLLCNGESFGSCSVKFRFDDEEPAKVVTTTPSDNSSNYIFFQGIEATGGHGSEEDLIRKIMNSKRVLIAPEFFQNGTIVMEFNVSGLKFNLPNQEDK